MIENQITGVILAGGESSRFNSNKALALIEDSTMLEHIHNTLLPFCANVVVSGDYLEYKRFNIKTQPDLLPQIGPLGGIYSLLKTVDTPYLLFLTCDMPLVNGEIIHQLIEQGVNLNCRAAVYQLNNNPQPFPLFMANTNENIEAITHNIMNKQYSMRKLLEHISYVKISINEEERKNNFVNINNLETYKTLKTFLHE